MKNLIQKYFMAIVAVMMMVGFSAFKVAESITTKTSTDWYEVGPNDIDPNTVEVKGLFMGTPIAGTDDDECATLNPGDQCAVQLTLGPNAEDPIGKELSEVLSDPDITEGASLYHPDNNRAGN